MAACSVSQRSRGFSRQCVCCLFFCVVLPLLLPHTAFSQELQPLRPTLGLDAKARWQFDNNTTCWTYNSTGDDLQADTECAIGAATQPLFTFASLLSASNGSIRLFGQWPGAPSSLTLSAEQPVRIGAGMRLELFNVKLDSAQFRSAPVNPHTSLELSGIDMGSTCASPNCTRPKLFVQNSTVQLDCAGWDQLQVALCLHGKAAGDFEVYADAVFVLFANVGGVSWRNVWVLPSCRTPPVDLNSSAVCALRRGLSGTKLLDDLASLQAQGFPTIIFALTSPLVLPHGTDKNVSTISANVTLMGNATATARLDVNLLPAAFVVRDGGSLTFRNLFLLNMIPRVSTYPLGLLSCFMWFVEVNRTQAADQLNMVNVTVLVPPSELDYLRLVVNPGTGVAPWTLGPSGIFVDAPRGIATTRALVFSTATLIQGRWTNVSLMVLDTARDPEAKLSWTGLDALLLPDEPTANLVLPTVQPLGAQLNLSALRVNQDWSVDSRQGPVRMIMSQSLAVNRDTALSMVEPITVARDTVIVGNTLSPDGALFDVGGLTCMSAPPTDGGGNSNSSFTGFVSIGDSVRNINASLHLRDMVLVNLWPAACGGDPLQEPSDLLSAMGNYTSLLWMFNVNRDMTSTGGPGRLVLQNVTLVIPVSEFRVILQILIGSLKFNINPLAYQLLWQELGNMEMAAERSGTNIKYERMVGSALVGNTPPSPDALGTVTFPVFSWFGITGKQVTFTSQRPAAMSSSLLPVEAALWPAPSPPMPPSTPPAPQPPADPAPQAGPPTSVHAVGLNDHKWQLGLLIGCTILAAALLVLATWWMIRRLYGRGNDCFAESSSLDSSAADKESPPTDVEAAGGAPCSAALEMPPRGGHKNGLGMELHPLSKAGIQALDGHADSDSPSTSSLRGSPAVQAAETQQGAIAQSPFEAIALGLVSLAPSGPEAQGLPSRSDGVSGFAERAANGRLNTEVLLERIFNSASMAGVPHGQAHAHAPCSSGSDHTVDGRLWPLPESAQGPTLGTPTGSVRQEIQRQMEMLKEELGSEHQVPQWEIQGQLGKGAHGVVYKGTWRGLDVAIKRVIFQVLGDPVADARRKTALREAAINGTLHHPNIVTTYTHDMQPLAVMQPGGPAACMHQFADWQLFIIQEYCDGGSLYTAIQEQQFWDAQANQPRLQEVLSIMSDIASGCAYIHSKQIIHGDLKPDNVLLKWQAPQVSSATPAADDKSAHHHAEAAPCCVAKVADFGMSMRISGNNTHVSGVHQGTPLYVSPEILQDGRASKAADVYSFGVIMWELFHGMSAWNHLVRMVGAPQRNSFPAFHPGMFTFENCSSPAYAQLGQACLSANPADRPSFIQVLDGLQAMLAELGKPKVDALSVVGTLSRPADGERFKEPYAQAVTTPDCAEKPAAHVQGRLGVKGEEPCSGRPRQWPAVPCGFEEG